MMGLRARILSKDRQVAIVGSATDGRKETLLTPRLPGR